MRALVSILLVFCLSAHLAGCSWIAMKRVPEGYQPSQELECSGYKTVIIDGAAMGLFGGAAGLMTIGAESFQDRVYSAIFGGLFGLAAVLCGASGVTGLCWADTCSDARKMRGDWLKLHPEE
jgi:hypothetical protein